MKHHHEKSSEKSYKHNIFPDDKLSIRNLCLQVEKRNTHNEIFENSFGFWSPTIFQWMVLCCSYFDMKHSRWTKHMWNDVFVVWQRLFIFGIFDDRKWLMWTNKNQSLLTSILDLLLIMIFTFWLIFMSHTCQYISNRWQT